MERACTPTRRRATIALLALGYAMASCGTPPPPPQTGPKAAQPAASSGEQTEGTVVPPTDGAPATVTVGELAPDADREVRVTGVVEQILGMRLVPAKVIFKIRDNTGSVTVVINEKAEITEGQRVEIVGYYKAIPSPMHDGPGEGPEEPVFVVDRFIAF